MNSIFGNLQIIGHGSDANVNNSATIKLDKDVLSQLDRDRPMGGYPRSQEQAIAEMRQRVADYEAEHGVV